MEEIRISELFPEAADRYDDEWEPSVVLPAMFVLTSFVVVCVGAVDLINFYLSNIYGGL